MTSRLNPDDEDSGSPFETHFPFPQDNPGPDDRPDSESSGFGAGLSPTPGAADAPRRPRRRGRRKRGRQTLSSPGQEPAQGFSEEAPSAPPVSFAEAPSAEEQPPGRRLRSGRRLAQPAEGGAPDGQEFDEGGGGRKKRRRRRRRKSSADSIPAQEVDFEAATASQSEASSSAVHEVELAVPPAIGGGTTENPGGPAAKRRRRRGGRGRKRRNAGGGEKFAELQPELEEQSEAPVGIEIIPGEEDDLPAPPPRSSRLARATTVLEASPAAPGEGLAGRRRRRKKRKSSRDPVRGSEHELELADGLDPDEDAPPEVPRDQLILVNAIDPEEKRVAVVQDGKIIDLLMTVESQDSLVSDIYRGKVVNLEPAIGAAFVDFGQGRNGFLHTSDVLSVYGEEGFTLERLLTMSLSPEEWDEASSQPSVSAELAEDGSHHDDPHDSHDGHGRDEEGHSRRREGGEGRPRRGRKRLPITDLLKVGDYVVVQVTKDAIGDKGPTLTTYISIPGRYLVLMPSMERTGVSRKIEDEKERRRLKRILQSLKIPTGMGVIVRTAGIGKSKTELRRDLDYLLGVWDNFGKRLKTGRGPMPLYQESDVGIRTLRDLFHARTEAVIVDDPMTHEKLVEFAQLVMPEHVGRIRAHEGERPLFHHYNLEQDFEKVFARRIELPSGGSIVFDQTEALVAIDVNSGRTRSEGFDFEDIALKTNLDAVPEIARQIRLRDLGGIIVCDFIDMMRSSNIRQVERAFRNELAHDRARSKIGRISQFGLLEMTRQRLGPGTHKKVFQACPRCRGTGRIRTVQSRAAAILRRLGSALTQKGFSTVDVRAHPEVAEYLRNQLQDYLRLLEHRFEKQVHLTEVPDQPEDSVLRYLRVDGREVRPGGRRKR